jgi:hypothetical protein
MDLRVINHSAGLLGSHVELPVSEFGLSHQQLRHQVDLPAGLVCHNQQMV